MIVQPLQLMPACRSCSIAGSAVATMVWSMEAMNSPMDTMAKTSQRRCRGGAGVARTGTAAAAAAAAAGAAGAVVVAISPSIVLT